MYVSHAIVFVCDANLKRFRGATGTGRSGYLTDYDLIAFEDFIDLIRVR